MKINKVNSTIIVVFVMGIWVVSTILALTWGTTLNWPDFVHVNYGFPLVWTTHTLNTIAGPVDIWKVDILALFLDLLLWLGSMMAIIAVVLRIWKKRE
jgi:hypothetical protein